MQLIASLPWYDYPSSAAALDMLWADMRSRLLDAGLADMPAQLCRSKPLLEQWQHPGLVVSQCCGPDLFTRATAGLQCLGRPVFPALDCPPGYYYSHIVCRGALVSAPKVAINSPTSWSGNSALHQWLQQRGDASLSCLVSGSHEKSLELLKKGRVDMVAIDAHAWSFLDQREVSIVGRSVPSLTPPFVSGLKEQRVLTLIQQVLAESIQSHGHRLGISGLCSASKQLYESALPIRDRCPGSADYHRTAVD